MSPKPEIERREEPDLQQIVTLLQELDNKVTNHINEEALYKPKLLVLIEVFEQSKGAIHFIKWMAALAAAAGAAYTFLSTHITWKL